MNRVFHVVNLCYRTRQAREPGARPQLGWKGALADQKENSVRLSRTAESASALPLGDRARSKENVQTERSRGCALGKAKLGRESKTRHPDWKDSL